jgi:ribosomal-protein-alanine N-acetyltransferase
LNPKIQSGNGCNQTELLGFVNGQNLAYEHLDWFPNKTRLAEQSTFCLHSPDQLEAILSVAPETQDFAWLRFFFSRRDGKHGSNFDLLFQHSLIWLKGQEVPHLFSLATSEWFENLLVESGFQVQNKIISLVTSQISGIAAGTPSRVLIRPMRFSDLPEIGQLDRLCFSAPWQLNQVSLERCYRSGDYVSLATVAGKPVAYQITTRFLDHLHLARLAVHPELQRRGIAKELLFDLKTHYEDSKIESISVNTQIDNLSSLGLYASLGFKPEGNLLPVYCFDLT